MGDMALGLEVVIEVVELEVWQIVPDSSKTHGVFSNTHGAFGDWALKDSMFDIFSRTSWYERFATSASALIKFESAILPNSVRNE